jgi:hypothetical protein
MAVGDLSCDIPVGTVPDQPGLVIKKVWACVCLLLRGKRTRLGLCEMSAGDPKGDIGAAKLDRTLCIRR